MDYFLQTEKTEEALKKRYRELAMELHPDVGGTKEAFQELSNQYRKAVSRVRNPYSAPNINVDMNDIDDLVSAILKNPYWGTAIQAAALGFYLFNTIKMKMKNNA